MTLSCIRRSIAVAITADDKHAVSASSDNTLRVWDLATGRLLATFTADGAVCSCAVSRDGKRVVASDAAGRVHFLEPVETETRNTLNPS